MRAPQSAMRAAHQPMRIAHLGIVLARAPEWR
jgi:hypothetical protein